MDDNSEQAETSDILAIPEVRNHGQIAQMILPGGWVEATPYKFSGGIGTRSLREIHPPEAPEARLCFYYRGLPMSAEAGKNFRAVLDLPLHQLNEEEWVSLTILLEDKAALEDFSPVVARTDILNGKTLLLVAGTYREIKEDTFEVFVDANGDGRTIQQIFFQAPTELYRQYLKTAKESMATIRWV
jgi:hypothetical protein